MDDNKKEPGQKNPLGPVGRQVATNVSLLRTARGWSRSELSERVASLGRNIPQLGIARIETGARRVDADDLVALAVAFGVGPTALLFPHSGAPDELPEIARLIEEMRRDRRTESD
ncbi:helix-turn-helix transcriptional regulator [Streptomyces sp. NPDC049555]|uniref:helix-turn-helix domain-containing protein n=1 Tax=Streptomyces sp. NPDC049555 TaxID=3154930 RepID=UPI00344363C5